MEYVRYVLQRLVQFLSVRPTTLREVRGTAAAADAAREFADHRTGVDAHAVRNCNDELRTAGRTE